MDPARFDRLAKTLTTRLSRRATLAGLLGLAEVAARRDEAAAFGCHRVCHRSRRGPVCHITCHCGPYLSPCRLSKDRWTCVDLANDPTNCGQCGLSCGGVACQAGVCAPCPSDLTRCAGRCVDLAVDPTNCGSCDQVCPTEANCRGGVCCTRDGHPCPTACRPDGYCAGCCIEFCRADGVCDAPPPCVADDAPCPAGCAAGDCPRCCSLICRSDGTCGVPEPPCTADGQPCPAPCVPDTGCADCCAGVCATSGVCGEVSCQPYGGDCAASADCCNDVPCTNGHCHYP